MPEWVFLGLLFVLGLAFGSFANVVIWRFPRGESLSHPPSACPKCGTPIRWYDNVPVLSWLLLRAKCRACGAPISPRYPLVELLSGALWLLAGVLWGMSARTVAGVAMFYLLLILTFIDWDTMRLPNKIVGLLGGVGLAGCAVAQFTTVEAAPLTVARSGWMVQPLVAAIVGIVLGGGVSLAIALAYAAIRKAEGFGMGDVKLLAALGPFLGAYVLLVLFFGSLFGAVYGIIAVSAKGMSLRTKVPFGPFLAAGAVVAAVWGPSMWHWYVSLVTVAP